MEYIKQLKKTSAGVWYVYTKYVNIGKETNRRPVASGIINSITAFLWACGWIVRAAHSQATGNFF